MKRKEIKNLAKKIAKYELIVQNSNDEEEVRQAQQEIMTLSGHIESFEDIDALDEAIQEFLKIEKS